MDNVYDVFSKALVKVISQFGAQVQSVGAILENETLIIEDDVTAFIGIVGNLSGNIAYSFSKDTAKKIASAMMMGMHVEELDDIARSAISELSNMVGGNTITEGGSVFDKCDITTPELVAGEDVFLVLSQNKSRRVSVDTSFGLININIALEL